MSAIHGPPEPASEPGGGLARRAAGGVVWQGLSFVLGKAFTLVATVVLARLLAPSEFGLVGLALVFITFAEYASDLGVSQGVVYFPRDRRTSDGALALSAISGVVLLAAGLLLAPLVGRLFGEPDVVPMVQVLSASLLLGAVRQVPDALLRKELQFRRRAATELARTLVQGGLSIGLAAAGLGAWAIVWGYVAGSLVWCASAWLLVDYRPTRRFWRLDRPLARRLLGYGAPAAAQGLLAAIVFDIDYVIVGEMLGTEALGLYILAFRVPQLLIVNVLFVLAAVAFPLFSRVHDAPARLKRGYLTSVRLQGAYGAAAAAGLFMVAPMLVPVVFGSAWEGTVVPLQALALYAGFRALGAGAVDLYKGVGRPGVAAVVSAARLVVLVPALLIAAQHGIHEVAWTQAGLALLFAVGMQSVACRFVRVSPSELLRAFRPALAAGVGTALGAGAARWLLPASDEVRLVVGMVAGAAAGFVALWLADAQFVRDVKALLSRRARDPVTAAA